MQRNVPPARDTASLLSRHVKSHSNCRLTSPAEVSVPSFRATKESGGRDFYIRVCGGNAAALCLHERILSGVGRYHQLVAFNYR